MLCLTELPAHCRNICMSYYYLNFLALSHTFDTLFCRFETTLTILLRLIDSFSFLDLDTFSLLFQTSNQFAEHREFFFRIWIGQLPTTLAVGS